MPYNNASPLRLGRGHGDRRREQVVQYPESYAQTHPSGGCGNSGAGIALDLAEQGVDVAMVVRGPVHVVPRDLFGRPPQHTNVLLSHLPLALRDAIAMATIGLVVGDLSRWGIVRPAVGPNRMIEEAGRIPILDLGTIAMVKRGKFAHV